MFKSILMLISAASIALTSGCSDQSGTNSGQLSGEWLIPLDEVFDGGPGKDGIPALSNPNLIDAAQASFLGSNDLVLGVSLHGEQRAYPHPILDWHEIMNDEIQNSFFAVTYCPLTGSGIVWDRSLSGTVTTFGVSGLLYNTNLIPYDRASGSNWSQMKLLSVNGNLAGKSAELFPVVETGWDTWKKMYPQAPVVSTNTGYSRSYGRYPYGDYRTNDNRLLFPVDNDDGRLDRKERVLGVIVGSTSKVYPINQFPADISVVTDTINGRSHVVVGSSRLNFAVAFQDQTSDGTRLSFSPLQDELPSIMIDDEGTTWDVFGYGISGPRAGEQLTQSRSFVAYWFAWAAFYPGAAIHP
ncbi:MAG: DUF3179 domain-containing protein [candidate division Zixibacteria bacterium]|nr:DUF3179 domain-containing protein [candidate division Zixibacteria bacterium]MDH3937485.1 DUF3179 domain-containing protein [candidate division Zixibacteria bacterium]